MHPGGRGFEPLRLHSTRPVDRSCQRVFSFDNASTYVGLVGRYGTAASIDTYTKVAVVKLYDRKNALVAADTINDRVLPLFEEHDIPLLRILTDRGTEYCGSGKYCFGKPPMQTFLDSIPLAKAKMLDYTVQEVA